MLSRLLSSLEHSYIAAYYGLQYLTPANLRSVRQLWSGYRVQVQDWRSERQALRQPKQRLANMKRRGKRYNNQSMNCLLISSLLLASTSYAFAQAASPANSTTATAVPAAATISPAKLTNDVLALRDEGNAALYNIDYATARTKFEELRKLQPQHPAGDLYLATTIWLEYLNRNRRLQTSLYRDDSRFYAGAENTKEDNEGDAVDPAVDKAFRARIEQAKLKGLALYNRDKKDVDALYFLGAVHGVLAGYEATTARKFFAAMRAGSRCVDLHQKALELNPSYHEALLSVGSYHYVVGNLPFALKALAAIGGFRGDKKKGIAELQTLISKNAGNSDDARVLLLAIMQNEKRPQDALAQLQYLSAKYPRSYLLRLETATTLAEQQKTAEAYAAFEALLKDPTAAPITDLVHFQFAEALAANSDYARAATNFLAVPQIKTAEASLATIALLRAAQVYDQAGQRETALAQYKTVLTRPNAFDSREQAERGLKQPYRPITKEKKNP